jgi:hypothetical protein
MFHVELWIKLAVAYDLRVASVLLSRWQTEGRMTRTAMAGMAAILLTSPALGETPEQIRAKLLATPDWT